MTCEVAIANRLAIALAADSAVTHSAPGRSPTFSSGANKIFQLSNTAPVAAMIFNNSTLAGIPWELIIKSYRSFLGEEKFKLLDDYSDSFIKYLCSCPLGLISEIARTNAMWGYYYFDALDALQYLENKFHEIEGDYEEKLRIIDSIVKSFSEELNKEKNEYFSSNITNDDVDKEIDRHAESLIKKISEENETAEHKLTDASLKHCRKIVEASIRHTALNGPRDKSGFTGIVFSGFGEDQYFPAYIHIHIYGYYNGKIIFRKEKSEQINENGNSSILEAFAQSTMIETFSQGMSPDVWSSVNDAFATHVKNICRDVSKSLNVELNDELLTTCVSKHSDHFKKDWSYRVFDSHLSPLWNVISSLGLTDLAELAETLVSLESLKERVTHRTQSVGGPIDVAILTKSDGLIWIKRKLYFEPALNHRYFGRLQQQLGGKYD